ncbi:MAG: Response regulator [Parcubacteria group bacterium GW2011_GWC1_42_11]|uniref:Response regulator n=1 Tax=Candidatus Nomurabacteria bacterium GW2011_GWC2_42_20 TaxID=1618756 RepID=A0A0G1CEY3_9BACT|nr:MAG: Response regulator [Parcubacteria group bacterium GW2011_GWC1_42_11]KKS48093.1 MAG: Response regulator [Candidatus Nomurabacteria bacterium GW2011_GWC2_42_20]KKS58232.1 MAG: Response regulator [Candidatus Nomurabacteria bacterium GW2011_GWA2_42_41]KKT09633.1 MAG: Response regulator [Candidatus Nomurabacteria bacterium GW2011_GWB1_43_20]TAN36455.1 MAG: hypothetical protein EPN27_01585 [Patescibacteria group bacterium]HBH71424.1 hypothetical protein [Candidatus Yonathbacteria bacterium]
MIETIATKVCTILATVGMDKAEKWIKAKYSGKKVLSIEEIKKITKILFIDDEDFGVTLSTIRNAGWNVNQINDVINFDAEDIKSADIIFMDYVGVGNVLTPKESGIGLLKSIKKRYPEKFIIFCSGYAGHIPGSEVHSIADAWIDKHADAFVFVDQIEVAAKKIHESR